MVKLSEIPATHDTAFKSQNRRIFFSIIAAIALLVLCVLTWDMGGNVKKPIFSDPLAEAISAELDNPGSTAQPIVPDENDTQSEPIPEPEPEPESEPNPEFESTPTEISWGNRNKKQVIFTFDGGSGEDSARAILDTLARFDIDSTFFLTGKFIELYPLLAKEMALDHEVFNHTYSHPHLTQITDAEIYNEFSATENLLQLWSGKTTKPYFRPPYGERNQHVLDVAASQGYRSVYWTVDALDWKESEGMTGEQVKTRILDNLSAGTIYLMHIGDTITGTILPELIPEIRKRGYSIVSLTQGLE